MKRLFFMVCLCVLLVFILIQTLNVHLITSIDESISVRILYGHVIHDFELEPYTLLSEVLDLIDIGDDVDFRKLNLNQVLAHKDILSLPLFTDIPCVSINSGSVEDLVQIKGIGEKTAQSILAHRNSVGFFQSIEDLLDVKGIGPSKFELMKDQLCL